MPNPPERSSWEIPEEAKAALRQGNKIQAIKIVRELTGLGLAEAKEAVERGEYAAPAPGGASASDGKLPLEALMALKKGDKIGAIKIVRTAFGLGLKEAKDRVDASIAGDPALRAEMESVVQRGRPGRLLWILLIFAVAGLVFYFTRR